MRSLPIAATVLALLAVVTFSSCGPSRVYATKKRQQEPSPPPPPRMERSYSTYSLIISPTPGFVMQRYPDGRYYHRNRAGMLYWKGYDDRFYLDRSYLHRVRYTQREYTQWRNYMRENDYGRR